MDDNGTGPAVDPFAGLPGASARSLGGAWQAPGDFGGAGRGSRMLGGTGRRATVISTVSTLVMLAALAAVFLLAPGARQVEHAFFNPHDMWQSFVGNPRAGYYSVGAAIWLNIRMFIAAEVLILVLALVIALIRQSTHPAMFPIRTLSTIYVDFFRGVPLILVIFAIGLGIPALSLPVVSSQSDAIYGVAAAGSLGLSHRSALRPVILPQAVRNIIPPLLNDFISLQKDTALVGILGTIEANKAADIYSEQVFNFSSFTVAAILFLILTIPLARFTDRLIERDRRRRLAGATA